MLSLGIRMFRLDFYSLWYDEATTADLLQDKSVGKALNAILDTSGSETLHPFYYLVLSAWMQISGSSEWALRFPSVVFGSCATVVYALLLYQIGGKKAFVFSSLLIISPFLMWYSRDARPYALIMLLTGLHFLFYLKLSVKPKSKMVLTGFIVIGVLMVYSGILAVMLLFAEFVWSLFIRRKAREIVAVAVIMLLVLPLAWHGWQTHFAKSSKRYYELPKGMNAVRIVSIPQEFFVARSLGPTPDEVRRSPLTKTVRHKSTELAVEMLAIISILLAFLVARRSSGKSMAMYKLNKHMVHTLGFIAVACVIQVTLLISLTGYRMNARHLAFLFGPLFILGVLPVAYSKSHMIKVSFTMPLLVLWMWSCTNQIFDPSYGTDDYRSTAKIIKNDEYGTSQIIGLCHPKALQYYGINKPLVYFREAPDVTCNTLTTYFTDEANPSWLILSRPWNYPSFHPERLTDYFRVLREKHLPGIDMWLLTLRTSK
jgi:hypothetical protein